MDKMKDLRDLLTHEVLDLCSAEDQIIVALPKMVEKAKNGALKKALKEHLKVTEAQRKRLDKVQELLKAEKEDGSSEKSKGFLAGLFGGSEGKQVCRGMMGLIQEGEKVMNEDMDPDVLDAAIIASAQKIEHYEICGYGTARAFARELNERSVADLLEKTLNEEYEADDLLTALAVGGLNQVAEGEDSGGKRPSAKKSTGGKKAASKGKKPTGAKKSGPSRGAASKSAAPKGAKAGSKTKRARK